MRAKPSCLHPPLCEKNYVASLCILNSQYLTDEIRASPKEWAGSSNMESLLGVRTVCKDGACTLLPVRFQRHWGGSLGDRTDLEQLRKETKGLEQAHVGAIFPLRGGRDVRRRVRVAYLEVLYNRLMVRKGMSGFHVRWTFLFFST